MGNICSSYSSTSTQTGSVHKKRGNLAQEIQDVSQPVEKKTWDDVFDHVVRTDLWEGTTRAVRSEWKPYLRKIDELLRAPRKEIGDEKVKQLMRGGLPCEDLFDNNRKIILYVSSAGIDTEAERTVLMKDVYPFIKATCRQLDMEFEVVDLRWGTNNAEQDDLILKTSQRELQRCCDSKNGFIFLCFLREDYGTRILPQEIEEETLDTIMAYLINNEIDTSLIKQYYTLDKNPIRRKYILKADNDIKETVPIAPDIKTRLLQQLIETIPECFPYGQEMISKYCASMYEYEVQTGLKCGQSIFIKKITDRTSNELADNTKENTGHLTYNKYNQEQLDSFNKEIAKKLEETGDTVFTLTYDDMHEMATGENVMQLSDHVCEKILQYVIQYFQTKQTFAKDLELQEVVLQQKHSLQLSQDFYGREKETETVRKYLEDDKVKVPMIVHGVEGVGKSAFMAATAQKVKLPHYVLVLRHIGITEESTHVKDLLESICIQLARAYNKPLLNTSASFKDLVSCFRDCLHFATKKDPIILFLISMNNLSNENLAHNLSWLLQDKQKLPDNVKIVISTPPGPGLDVLRRIQPNGQFVEIAPLCESDVSGMLQKKLAGMGQQITYDQTERLVDLYRKGQSLLFLNLAINLASTWRSFDTPELLEDAVDLFKLFELFLQSIEKKHGPILVQHSLGYLTSSKHGLSINELEDILSCDDEVLDEIFRFQSPTVRRIPSRSLKPLKQDLDSFFVERNFRGMTVLTWCRPEVTAMVTRRYLTGSCNDREPFDRKARTAIADYFDNKWTKGKIYSNLSSTTTEKKYALIHLRCVMSQPLVLYGNRYRRQFNTRKLHELPYQISKMKEWKRFQGIMRLGFLEAKFEDGLGFECVRNISQAAKMSESKVLKQLARLIASNLTVLRKEPFAIYQIASQCQQSSPIFKMLKSCDARDIPMKFIRNVSGVKEDATCEMTLLGHSGGVRYCDISPSGDTIVSTADDGSMNIWYVITGMELAAITSLPLPIDGDGNDVLPSNPCCFSTSGERIAVGTQDGDVIMLDSSGTMLAEENTDIENITCLKFSHDGKTLVTSFKQGQVYFWDAETLEHQSTIQLEDVITGLDISPDDQILAIACARGLVLADMNTRVILSSGAHTLTLESVEQEVPDVCGMCCVFHPNGKEVLIGSSDNSISQWNAIDGNIVNRVKGHLGRVTSIKLNKDGDLMFSASMDRTIKMWSFKSSWTCTSTLVGHSDIVTMVTLDPVKEAYLVSASLDGSLKVWNIEAILKTEEEIHERDDGFEEGSDVTDQDGDTDSSENVPFSTLSFSPTTGAIVYSKGLDRYCRIRRPGCPTVNTATISSTVKQASFTADGSNVVILDSGFNPEGKRSGKLKSSLLICDSETGNKCHVIHASEFADDEMPTKFCCGAWFIAIGTNKGDVHVFDDKAFERLQQISWHDEITEMATCTVKNYVIAVSFTQAIIWKVSLDRYETVAYLPEVEFNYTKCAFSPLGNCLVTCFENGEIHIWNISDKEITLSVSRTEHTSKIKDASFSRSGDVMVTCADRSMRVWDITNGAKLKCAYYSPIDRLVCVEEDVVLAGDFSGKLNTLTW